MATKQPTKVIKAKEVKTMDQLQSELLKKQNDLLEARRGHAAGELANPRMLTALRKDIARLKTAIRAEELSKEKDN